MVNKTSSEQDKIQSLLNIANEMGAYKAKFVSTSVVVVEQRAQLKCLIPRCTSYGKSLTCPPNMPNTEEVRKLISEYHMAIMFQVKGTEEVDGATEEMRRDYNWVYPAVYKLHEILHALEVGAFNLGYYLAMGIGGGDCRWCEILSGSRNYEELHANAGGCAGATNESCRQHYRARPAMEAMSINVLKTAENAGMPFYFSGHDEKYVIWNGIVLID